MATLTVLAGMPCAGKSTYAAKNHRSSTVISYDVIAELFSGGEHSVDGHTVHRLLLEIVETRCRLDADTVVDATNLRLHERLVWKLIAEKYEMACELVVCMVSATVAYQRNEKRASPLSMQQIATCWFQQHEMMTSIELDGFDRVFYVHG